MKSRLMLLLASIAMMFTFSSSAFANDPPHGGWVNSNQPTPQRIAGYEVLGVESSDNMKCYFASAPTVILAATSQSVDSLLSEDAPDMDAIKRGLKDEGYPEGTSVGFAGPGITKQMVEEHRLRWNAIREERGCIQFGGPQDS